MYNAYLTEALTRMRYDDDVRRAAHEGLLARDGLDYASVFGRAMRRLLRRDARAVGVAHAADPIGAAHGALALRTHLIKPQPAGTGGDERNAAA